MGTFEWKNYTATIYMGQWYNSNNSISVQTLSREANLTQMINDFDSKSPSDKASLHYFILDVGTYTSGKLDPIFLYFSTNLFFFLS